MNDKIDNIKQYLRTYLPDRRKVYAEISIATKINIFILIMKIIS